MSHVVEIATQVRSAAAASAACRRLGLAAPAEAKVKLFIQSVSGLAVQLDGWRYPVVFDLPSGKTQHDNYGERWGKQQRLDEFLQAYAVEAATIEARRGGHRVT